MAQPAPPANTWHMYRSMVGIGILCGLLIVSVFEATRPVIARKKAEALQRAIFQVLPAASSSETFRFVAAGDGGTFEALEGEPDGDALVYAGYGDGGELIGVAVEAQGMGYQDVIRLLYGYSPADEAIVGIRVLDTKETPGLGTKIETDPAFLENFRSLDVSLSADGSEIANPIVSVKHGTKTEAWQIDAITGATISSAAVASILERSSAYWIPRIRRGLDEMRQAGPP
jgi:electron transport complex protein RnfG